MSMRSGPTALFAVIAGRISALLLEPSSATPLSAASNCLGNVVGQRSMLSGLVQYKFTLVVGIPVTVI